MNVRDLSERPHPQPPCGAPCGSCLHHLPVIILPFTLHSAVAPLTVAVLPSSTTRPRRMHRRGSWGPLPMGLRGAGWSQDSWIGPWGGVGGTGRMEPASSGEAWGWFGAQPRSDSVLSVAGPGPTVWPTATRSPPVPAPLMKTMLQSPALAINHLSRELKGKWMELSGGPRSVLFPCLQDLFTLSESLLCK